MKSVSLATLVFFALAFTGCSGGVGVIGGSIIPGSGTNVRVLNSTSYTLTVAYGNQEIALRPGQYHIAHLPRNLTGTGSSVVIQVITHHNGEVLTASNPYPVYQDSYQEFSWEIQEYDLR